MADANYPDKQLVHLSWLVTAGEALSPPQRLPGQPQEVLQPPEVLKQTDPKGALAFSSRAAR